MRIGPDKYVSDTIETFCGHEDKGLDFSTLVNGWTCKFSTEGRMLLLTDGLM